MIITCPNCATHYNIQPALLGDGCHTRCFNCGYSWFQGPVVSPPPPPMVPRPVLPQTGIAPPQQTFLDAASLTVSSPSTQIPDSKNNEPKSDSPKTINERQVDGGKEDSESISKETLDWDL